MRLIFIPGFGEDPFIFDRIQAELPGDKLFLSLWDLLPDRPVRALNVSTFAQELVERYHITRTDLLIGHSTGGWVALHVKQLVGCPIIQLASWTDGRKVVAPIPNRHLVYFAAGSGMYLNRSVMQYLVKNYYHDKPSLPVFERVFGRLISGSRACAVNQLRLIFNPPTAPVSVTPDLRIHARADRIIRFPDGPVYEVPGDHFSLYTYPDEVLAGIRQSGLLAGITP